METEGTYPRARAESLGTHPPPRGEDSAAAGGTAVPYDQRIARTLAPALATLGVHPNLVTLTTLVLALLAAWLFALGDPASASWAAGFFVLARFLDHVDGELARQSDSSSRLGYYLDYVAGALSYACMFAGIGIGLAAGPLGPAALWLGALGASAALVSLGLNLNLDRLAGLHREEAVGYPAYGGFELEDGIYLLAPICWLGWLTPFFVVAGIGAAVYCMWTLSRVLRTRGRSGPH